MFTSSNYFYPVNSSLTGQYMKANYSYNKSIEEYLKPSSLV